MKRNIAVVSYLIILLFIFTTSCGVRGWQLDYEVIDAEGCKTVRYKKVLADRVEYKEVVTCPDRPTTTRTWAEYN